jgi:glyoxylase-like metal-dependent hydrolase (beta-lactamase superfamily II)
MEEQLIQLFGTYHSWKINDETWVINGLGGSQNMYLLEGEKQALLLDTFWGAGNLRKYIESLTDKPLLVANTHGHMDHVGNNGEWETVYMHKDAIIDMETVTQLPFDISCLPHPDYEKKLIGEGYVFHLGKRDVRVMDIAAHSFSSLGFFDEKYQMFFAGDEIDAGQVLMFPIQEFPREFNLDEHLQRHHANMLRIRDMGNQIRYLMPNHSGAPIANSYLDDYIELTEKIYSGEAVIEDDIHHEHVRNGYKGNLVCRARWKLASFFVLKPDLMNIYGKGF